MQPGQSWQSLSLSSSHSLSPNLSSSVSPSCQESVDSSHLSSISCNYAPLYTFETLHSHFMVWWKAIYCGSVSPAQTSGTVTVTKTSPCFLHLLTDLYLQHLTRNSQTCCWHQWSQHTVLTTYVNICQNVLILFIHTCHWLNLQFCMRYFNILPD